MNDLRQAAQEALEALESGPDVDPIFVGETIDALRDALAQPERKPLTDELIDILARSMVKGDKSVNWLCRVIEAEHGIGGEHE